MVAFVRSRSSPVAPYHGHVRIVASPRAVEFVRDRGGRLFVWIERLTC